MLTRKRYREVPPRVDYDLTERARELMPILGELARWGYDWVWSAPRSSEAVDIGAIFRLAPGLVHPASGTDGTVEFTVNDAKGSGEAVSYSLTAFAGNDHARGATGRASGRTGQRRQGSVDRRVLARPRSWRAPDHRRPRPGRSTARRACRPLDSRGGDRRGVKRSLAHRTSRGCDGCSPGRAPIRLQPRKSSYPAAAPEGLLLARVGRRADLRDLARRKRPAASARPSTPRGPQAPGR